MKKTIYLIGMMVCLLVAASCEKEERYDYRGGNQIYFANEEDSMTYSFAIQKSSVREDVVEIPVAISGLAADEDRVVRVAVVAETTTAIEGDAQSGGHFQLGETVLRQGEITANIPVTVYRQDDLKDKEVVVCLQLVCEGTFLGDMVEDKLAYKLKINDILSMPANWNSYIRHYFGEYGPVKYQFIIDTLGIAEFPESGPDAVSKAEMGYYKDKLRNALIAYEKENGYLYEEGNVRVTF